MVSAEMGLLKGLMDKWEVLESVMVKFIKPDLLDDFHRAGNMKECVAYNILTFLIADEDSEHAELLLLHEYLQDYYIGYTMPEFVAKLIDDEAEHGRFFDMYNIENDNIGSYWLCFIKLMMILSKYSDTYMEEASEFLSSFSRCMTAVIQCDGNVHQEEVDRLNNFNQGILNAIRA